MKWFLLAMSALVAAAADAGAPDFVPNPKQAFEGFVAVGAPRPDVPVGALWIEGYGPTGDGAATDNLETIASLNGLSIDRNLQLSLTAGLFNLIGIEPRYRDHFTARFTDLKIIRVKDVTKLAGPPGEPRIIAAIKAGSVTVASDGEVGINGRTGWQLTNYEGTAANGRSRAYTIEGRDLFIAVRVATPKIIQSDEKELSLVSGSDGLSAQIDDFGVLVRRDGCAPDASPCTAPPKLGIVKYSTHGPTDPGNLAALDASGHAVLPLPVPIADWQGGLYDRLSVRFVPACDEAKVEACGRHPRLFAHYEGTRIQDLKSPDAFRW